MADQLEPSGEVPTESSSKVQPSVLRRFWRGHWKALFAWVAVVLAGIVLFEYERARGSPEPLVSVPAPSAAPQSGAAQPAAPAQSPSAPPPLTIVPAQPSSLTLPFLAPFTVTNTLANRDMNDLNVECWFHKAIFEPGPVQLDEVLTKLNEKPLPRLRPNEELTARCPIQSPLAAPQTLSFGRGEVSLVVEYADPFRTGRHFCTNRFRLWTEGRVVRWDRVSAICSSVQGIVAP